MLLLPPFWLVLTLGMSPFLTSMWGIEGGELRRELLAQFSPTGQTESAHWTSQKMGRIEVLRYDCLAQKRCFSHPSRAEFFLYDGRVASFTFFFSRESGPQDTSVASVVRSTLAQSGLTQPTITKSAVGRRIHYFVRDTKTVLWVQDGADAEIKLYVDRHNPVGRAEAVTAGARVLLAHLPGAPAYSQAHAHILAERFPEAQRALEMVLETKDGSEFLKEQARYVLAMVLATQVKMHLDKKPNSAAAWIPTAKHALDRAMRLAPSLRSHLQRLMSRMPVEASRP